MEVMPWEFEEIFSQNTTQVMRSKVPGGWLVSIVVNAPRGVGGLTTNFVVDPNHEWKVK